MTKISKEEYEVLKELDDKWKWIARDLEGELYTFVIVPFKNDKFNQWRNQTCDWVRFENSLFQFIKWEDEEPYGIQELIDDYLDNEYGYFNMSLSREFEEFIKGGKQK